MNDRRVKMDEDDAKDSVLVVVAMLAGYWLVPEYRTYWIVGATIFGSIFSYRLGFGFGDKSE
jgi:hypothetical protein